MKTLLVLVLLGGAAAVGQVHCNPQAIEACRDPKGCKCAPVDMPDPLTVNWSEAIEQMKLLAKKAHMSYWIFCAEDETDPTKQFVAMVCSLDCRRDFEDSIRVGGWGPTQAGAAVDLLINYHLHGFFVPAPEPPRHTKSHKTCPPPIAGNEYLAPSTSK